MNHIRFLELSHFLPSSIVLLCCLQWATANVGLSLNREMSREPAPPPGSTSRRSLSRRPCTWPWWRTWASASSLCLATSEISCEPLAWRSATSPRSERNRRQVQCAIPTTVAILGHMRAVIPAHTRYRVVIKRRARLRCQHIFVSS